MAAITIPNTPDGGHMATPVQDSCYSERTSLRANLRSEACYPIIAVCKTCHGRIRLAFLQQMEWAHVPAEQEDRRKLAQS
jgi:hypothetical protein